MADKNRGNKKDKDKKKGKGKDKKAPKSLRTDASDSMRDRLLTQGGQPKDNVQWRTREKMGELLCPELVARDKALLEERKSADEDRGRAIKAEQREIKDEIVETIFSVYPDLKALIDSCPTKSRVAGAGSRKPRNASDFVRIAVKRVQEAQAQVEEIMGEPLKELREAEAQLERAARNTEMSGRKRERLQDSIDQLEARLADCRAQLAELDEAVDLKEMQARVDKLMAKVENKRASKAVAAAQDKVDAANADMEKVAKAVARGKSVSVDAQTEAFIIS